MRLVATDMHRTLDRLARFMAFPLVGGSLLWRWIERGDHYPGWDLVGPAHGLNLLSTRPLIEALLEVLRSTRHFQYWTPVNSLAYTIVPGGLAVLWPWEYWGHVLTLLLTCAAVAAGLAALGLRGRDSWLLVLACGSSPALLSFSICGYPYATGALPYALALAIVAHRRLRDRWLLTLSLGLLAGELTWHVYEAGKASFVVFAIGALVDRHAPSATRRAWAVLAALQAASLGVFPGANLRNVFRGLGEAPLATVAGGARTLGRLLADGTLDLPLLPILALACLLVVKRQRALLIGCLLSQALPLAALAGLGASEIRSRRVITLVFLCALCVVAAWRDLAHRPRVRAAILVLLLAGNLAQLTVTWRFFATPPPREAPLPYTYSAADYRVPAPGIDASRWVGRQADQGRILVLLHTFETYAENTTDPAGLLERLYLSMGHRQFVRSVAVFGGRRCRYDCLPIRERSQLVDFVDEYGAGRNGLIVYPSRETGERWVRESAGTLRVLRAAFELRPEPGAPGGYGALAMICRRTPSKSRMTVLEASYASPEPAATRRRGFPFDVSWLAAAREASGHVETLGAAPFAFHWRGRLQGVAEPSNLLVGVRGDARLAVSGRGAWNLRSEELTFHEIGLDKSQPVQEVAIELRGGPGARLLVDLMRPGFCRVERPTSRMPFR